MTLSQTYNISHSHISCAHITHLYRRVLAEDKAHYEEDQATANAAAAAVAAANNETPVELTGNQAAQLSTTDSENEDFEFKEDPLGFFRDPLICSAFTLIGIKLKRFINLELKRCIK